MKNPMAPLLRTRPAFERPLCRGVGCDIEVSEIVPYCPVHEWVLDRWLADSRKLLAGVRS